MENITNIAGTCECDSCILNELFCERSRIGQSCPFMPLQNNRIGFADGLKGFLDDCEVIL